MVDKEKGYAFQQRVRRIAEKYDWKPQPPRFTPKKEVVTEPAAPEISAKEEKPWWKLW
jgi:hypothetical protein